MIRYKRVLLKLSGEALMGDKPYGFDTRRLTEYAEQVKEIADLGVQTAIVIGGGNIFRGLQGAGEGYDRVKGDQMGMLATVINGLALHSTLERVGVKAKVMTAIRMEPVGEAYSQPRAVEELTRGTVVIFTGGTGNPYFTTDTAAALRAVEIKADVLLKGTRVDGVYSADPEKEKDATRFDAITFDLAYQKNLKIMDLTAFTLCRENNLPIVVFDMNLKGNLLKIVRGEQIGTLVSS
jgi:uridylate kinase